jgi:hypothetical protein
MYINYMILIQKLKSSRIFSLLVYFILILIGYELSCKFVPKRELGQFFCNHTLFYILFLVLVFFYLSYF